MDNWIHFKDQTPEQGQIVIGKSDKREGYHIGEYTSTHTNYIGIKTWDHHLNIFSEEQDEKEATYANKIEKEEY